MKTTLRLVCSWCERVIREGTDKRVSHGCCKPCYERLLKEIRA